MKIRSFVLAVFFTVFFVPQVYAIVQTPKKGTAGMFYRESYIPTPTPPFSIVEANKKVFQKLGVKWFYSWHAEMYGFDVGDSSCVEFVPMIRYYRNIQESYTKIRTITNAGHTGIYWLIGNEPDFVGPDSDGKYANDPVNPDDPTGPKVGIEGVLDNYVLSAKKIKQLDPTAKIIIGGFLTISNYPAQNEPPALNMARILKDKLQSAGITPAGWHIHLYNCCDFNNFKLALARWRNWQNYALGTGETWLTEFGSIQERAGIDQFMENTVNFMETNTETWYHIDRYSWFYTISADPWTHTGLVNPNPANTLTPLGVRFSNLPANGSQPIYCPKTEKGWNRLFLSSNYTRGNFPNCYLTKSINNFWTPILSSNLKQQQYYLSCK